VSEGRAGTRRSRLKSTGVSGELVEQLNTFWRISGPEGSAASLRQRIAAPFRRALTRLLATQETFNASVVQYVNADQQRLDILDEALDRFDTAVDDARRHQEALAARERRMDEAMAAMRVEHDQLRTSIGVLQRAASAMQRELADSRAGRDLSAVARSAELEAPRLEDPLQPGRFASRPTGDTDPTTTLSHRYVGFEDQFRGSPETIRKGLAAYVPIFAGAADVLDIGCGRGEFLDLLREQGIGGRGIDLNGSMVDVCREKGLTATEADALSYLRAQPDESLGGLFAAQVVEHLEPAYLTHLLDAAFAKLRPGSPVVLETINPACWFAFFESYIRDITHVRPLHPETLTFLLVATGFQRAEIRYSAPYPEHDKLQPVPPTLGDAAETINANVEKINALLFTHLDYAAIAYRP
jgi:2-polyprenyl-3-methyl-5-hydroxy-6-metoxy-1,4-benzoquinol methylase